ncbi:MAG TPA: hypothetical protein VLJ14_08770 [Ktedonobacterales bacterium]|nr:hypothetical protein [Ktedonobacterales bacterium]
MKTSRSLLAAGVASAALALTIGAAAHLPAAHADGSNLFITSAHENADGTATFPLHRGTSHGQTVYYIILDTSDGNLSQRLGVNESRKLANAANTGAVQHISYNADGTINFPATVDFTPNRVVVPGPTGFPPNAAAPGAVGEPTTADHPAYSPLIQLPNGIIENAPQIARGVASDNSSRADKVVSIDLAHMTVNYLETPGFQGGNAVRYVSTDASDPAAAALEDATYAPALNAAPTLDDDSTASSRTTLVAFTNGQTGVNNPQRQGLNSAVLDGQSPLNVLRWNPSQGRYSPLWDVHLAQWTPAAIASGQNTRQTDVGQIFNLVEHGLVVGFNGTPQGTTFRASGFIVNCPIVSFA